MLRAELVRQVGGFHLSVELEVADGGRLVLAGESGAGKTSILRLLAGLDRPDSGSIRLGDETWLDSTLGHFLPAERRAVGYVPQEYGLFPHLDVSRNIEFGLRARGDSAAARKARVAEALERFRLTGLGPRRPSELSGGQRQRVALARALVLEPSLLLLDEPLSALDVQTRRLVRSELREILAGLPCATVYVTHSPLEALVFGERILVLDRGRVSQAGTAEDLLRHPRSSFVAEFMGVNLLQGRVVVREASGLARVVTAGGEVMVADPPEGDEVFLSISPREITLYPAPPAGSAQNVFAGTILELTPEPPGGERLRAALDTSPPLVAEITRQAVMSLGLREGMRVFAGFKASGVVPYR